jgi:hypothetical protein
VGKRGRKREGKGRREERRGMEEGREEGREMEGGIGMSVEISLSQYLNSTNELQCPCIHVPRASLLKTLHSPETLNDPRH